MDGIAYFLAMVEEYGEPDAWAKLYGDRKGEPLTPLEQASVDIVNRWRETNENDDPS